MSLYWLPSAAWASFVIDHVLNSDCKTK